MISEILPSLLKLWPNVVTESGITNEEIAKPVKASNSNVSIPSANVKVVTFVKLLNASDGMVRKSVVPFFSPSSYVLKTTEVTFVQLEKERLLNVVKEAGNSIAVNPVQFTKASSPIILNPSGRVRVLMAEQYLKAALAMAMTGASKNV